MSLIVSDTILDAIEDLWEMIEDTKLNATENDDVIAALAHLMLAQNIADPSPSRRLSVASYIALAKSRWSHAQCGQAFLDAHVEDFAPRDKKRAKKEE